ncbi:baeRF11 domain-containing protein [Desertihabitans aurantiacus]|uniref:baeRF11 domain-containing protein n=1 Tax=Desertihabitans aurantiacus TaxID=2282477 RepID=UPI001300211A|nr:hypothetical protein [Desertihabitans aurantiacus]
MLTVDLPTPTDLSELIDARDPASVTITLESSPIPAETERILIGLRNAIAEAERQLVEAGTPAAVVAQVLDPVREIEADHDFWRHQANSLVVLAAPGTTRTFRLANRLTPHVAVGDRFDLGGLLRAVSQRHGGFVLGLAEQDVRFFELTADHRAEPRALDLPDDIDSLLAVTDNHGQADRRGKHADGPQRERYANAVQDAVLPHVRGTGLPLILAATPELEPAYRAVNRYELLSEQTIDAHASSLDIDTVDARAREILTAGYKAEVNEWRELFGTRRSAGRATSSLAEVAKAATVGAVEELRFDIDATDEGTIDEDGTITAAPEPTPTTYNLVDEIAARVLRAGGTVRAVRQRDLVDGSPVAAMLRYPKESAGLEA